ncbi:MAG: tetratricopeptide repeat protein [Candidatus Acidiferrales bacterium]|jgi:tetratricopeptide (TPR) repeat protein
MTLAYRWNGVLRAALCVAVISSWAPLRAGARAADTPGAIQMAQRQFNQGNYAGAISTLQPAVSQSPPSAEAFYWLGRSYYELRDFDNAVASAERSVALDPKNSVYHQWLGRAYGEKADIDRSFSLARKVKKEFQAAAGLNPSNIAARRDLEEYCLDAPWIAGGSKDEALQQVNAIAAVDPVEGHLARALYDREGLKNNEQAESEYRQVLSAQTKNLDAYFEVADFFAAQNRPADMETAIQAAAQVSASDPRIAFYRGVEDVLAKQNLPGAEQSLKSYLASTPERSDWPAHASARIWLGRLYEAQGKRAEAAEQYRAALQLEPRRKDARASLEKLEKGSQ